MQELGFDVEGDAEDQKEEARRKRGQTESKSEQTFSVGISDEKLCAVSKEKLLDWRNKNQKRRLTRSVVGTSQYMAPEVIRGDHYDGRCDWWSVGIIMYECLFGEYIGTLLEDLVTDALNRIHSICLRGSP